MSSSLDVPDTVSRPFCLIDRRVLGMGAAMCAKRGGEGERWRRHEPRGCAPSRFEVDCWEAGPAGRGPDDWVWSAADANEQPWYEQLCRFVLAHEAADYGGLRSAQIAGTAPSLIAWGVHWIVPGQTAGSGRVQFSKPGQSSGKPLTTSSGGSQS